MYPEPALLSEIFLAELSGDNVKVHATEVGVAGEKALEEGESRARTLQGDVEPGAKWATEGSRRMLVAGESSTVPNVSFTDRWEYPPGRRFETSYRRS